jgi:hypothetical protein
VGVVAGPEVVEVGLGVALLAGELVLVAGGVGDDDDLGAVGHVVGLGLDGRAGVVGDHVGGVDLVAEVVMDGAAGIAAREAVSVGEDELEAERACGVAFGDGRVVVLEPVELAGVGGGLFGDALAGAVVVIGDPAARIGTITFLVVIGSRENFVLEIKACFLDDLSSPFKKRQSSLARMKLTANFKRKRSAL